MDRPTELFLSEICLIIGAIFMSSYLLVIINPNEPIIPIIGGILILIGALWKLPKLR